MKHFIVVLLLGSFLVSIVAAQSPLRIPRISQGAKVSQIVGLSEIGITYHRPGVKGRTIWGDLLKYDEIWRAGANEPTIITLSDESMIEGKKMGAGSYRIVVLPKKDGEWTVILNSETRNWGTVYEEKYDSLRFSVKPEAAPHEEWMSFSFTDLTPFSTRIVLAWEKVRLSFKVEFNTLAKLQASVGNWQILNSAARFALDNKIHSDEAKQWADRSIALDRNERNLQTKAELIAAGGNLKEAVTLAEEAIKIMKAKNPKGNTSNLEKLIAGWKSSK